MTGTDSYLGEIQTEVIGMVQSLEILIKPNCAIGLESC